MHIKSNHTLGDIHTEAVCRINQLLLLVSILIWGIKKVRIDLTVLTSSSLAWLTVCARNITDEDEDSVDLEKLQLMLIREDAEAPR